MKAWPGQRNILELDFFQNSPRNLHITDILRPHHQDQQDRQDPGGQEDVHLKTEVHDGHGPAYHRSLSDLCGDGGRHLLHHLRAAHPHVLLPLRHQGQAGLPHGLDRDDDPLRVRPAPHHGLHLLRGHHEVQLLDMACFDFILGKSVLLVQCSPMQTFQTLRPLFNI